LLFDTRPLDAALKLAATAVTVAERVAGEQQIVADGVSTMLDGLAQLRKRLDQLERSQADRRKLDAASEAARERLEIPKQPVVRDEVPAPSDELTMLPAPQPEDRAQLAAGEHEREDQGNLRRDLEVGAPPDPGTEPEFDPAELDKPPDLPRNPVAISLN